MFSKKTKYALHALTFLSEFPAGQPVLIGRIAEEKSIPKKFLEAILLELKRAGVLASKKGVGGGYYLLKDPSAITMAEVARLFDGAIALLPCAAHKYYEKCSECDDEETCGLRDVVLEIRDETVSRMKLATLSELVKRERRLRSRRK